MHDRTYRFTKRGNIIKTSSIILAVVSALLLFSNQALSKEILKSSVSPDYVNGIQAKFLQMIAKKLDVKLQIRPMPFARRLVELEAGNIDLMVGLSRKPEREETIYFIEPSYYTERLAFFVLQGKIGTIQKYEDLYTLRVGVTIGSKYFPKFDTDSRIKKAAVVQVEQNVNKLIYNRIDAFIHLKSAGLHKIEAMGLSHHIETSPFHPNGESIYLGISKKSKFMSRRHEIESIIKKIADEEEYLKIE